MSPRLSSHTHSCIRARRVVRRNGERAAGLLGGRPSAASGPLRQVPVLSGRYRWLRWYVRCLLATNLAPAHVRSMRSLHRSHVGLDQVGPLLSKVLHRGQRDCRDAFLRGQWLPLLLRLSQMLRRWR